MSGRRPRFRLLTHLLFPHSVHWQVWQSHLVLNQLQYTGMLDALTIRKEGFPARLTFDEFYDRYRPLAPESTSRRVREDVWRLDLGDVNVRKECGKALAIWVCSESGFQNGVSHWTNAIVRGGSDAMPGILQDLVLGKTKVLMRDAVSHRLDQARNDAMEAPALIIQKCLAASEQHKFYELMRDSKEVTYLPLQLNIRLLVCPDLVLDLSEMPGLMAWFLDSAALSAAVSSLEAMRLRGIKLDGCAQVPHDACSMAALSRHSWCSLQLRGIPAELLKLPSLREVSIRGCSSFDEIEPLLSCTTLTALDITGCQQITGPCCWWPCTVPTRARSEAQATMNHLEP